MELNAEQIIKALECCGADDGCVGEKCPYYANCQFCITRISKDALSLIKELTEENEAWQKQLITTEEKSGKAYYELACEVESLRKENESLHTSCTELTRRMQDNVRSENEELRKSNECDARKLKADTVREMQERLLAEFRKDERINYYLKMTLNQIANEMLEGMK